ncbi:MAG: superfamily protein [Ramlibacter sp.]|nr:superfamily protein [Ramlibacter sp.]
MRKPQKRAVLALAFTVVGFQPWSCLHADVVTDWNVIALNATAVPANSILQSRVMAIVHGAIYDTVRAIDQKGPAYAVNLRAPGGTSVDAAVAAAAHGVLVKLAPAQRQVLDAALDTALARVTEGRAKSDGVALGAQIAEKSVALRGTDQSTATVTFTAKPGARLYQVTPPHSMAAILPHWGAVTPFLVSAASGLEWKGPPAIGSADFARDFEEVKTLGARNSATRTADQTAAAVFWTVQTGVPWHAAARAAAAAKGLPVADNARLFAILSMATADSQIIAFAEKYKNPHWRPITAIRGAGALGVPALKADPEWEPLLGTPPHPEYPSAHAVFSGAAEAVLTRFFGADSVRVSVTFPPIFGVTRTYARFSQITEEVDNARVWGGIHFRSADRDGSAVGRRIGEVALRDFPRPADSVAEVR